MTQRCSSRGALASALCLLVGNAALAQPAPSPADEAPPPEPVAPPSPLPSVAAPTAPTTDATMVPPSPLPPAPVVRPPPIFAPWPASRLALDLRIFSSARWVSRAGKDLSEIRLDRGEVGARVGLSSRTAAELRLEAVRSAGDGGTLGVDGDSLVARVRVAQVGGTLEVGPVRIDAALGLVRDPWIATLETDYPLLPLSRTASERFLDWPAADLAATVHAAVGPVRVAIAVGNGEGLRYPERNQGKTTTGVVEVVPVHTAALRVVLAGVARDGSVGAASVRDRRLGGGATVISPYARLGVEAVRAWGVADRGELTGSVLAGWLDGTPLPWLSLAARGATLRLDGGKSSTVGGAVAVAPWPSAKGDLRVWLAVDRLTTSGAASPVPGAATGDATVLMLVASAEAPYVL